jgi:3-phenylpropionate/trans-cinnamate dioxygenase ferredoxin subunit
MTAAKSARSAQAESRHVVATTGELPEGTRKIVKVGGRSIGIFHEAGRYFAVRNACPHHGAPLCLGPLGGTLLPSRPREYIYGMENRVLRCPWHGYEFDVETGRAVYDPEDLRVKVYEVTVEGDDVVLHT